MIYIDTIIYRTMEYIHLGVADKKLRYHIF